MSSKTFTGRLLRGGVVIEFSEMRGPNNNYFIGRNFKNAVPLFVARKKSFFCPIFWSETSGND